MIKQKLQQDQFTAMKSADKDKVTVLRYILAQIQNKEIEKKANLTDEETIVVLRRFVKELNESIEAFTKGNRADLVAGTKKQLEIITPYLPAEITNDELKKEIQKIVDQNKEIQQNNLPAGRQAPKQLIGICVKALKSKAEPGRIIKILKSL